MDERTNDRTKDRKIDKEREMLNFSAFPEYEDHTFGNKSFVPEFGKKILNFQGSFSKTANGKIRLGKNRLGKIRLG